MNKATMFLFSRFVDKGFNVSVKRSGSPGEIQIKIDVSILKKTDPYIWQENEVKNLILDAILKYPGTVITKIEKTDKSATFEVSESPKK